jgi:putative phage-type endonuclease
MNLPKNLELEGLPVTESPERALWLNRRLKGLGATDINRIAKCSTFGNAYDVYCEKKELVEAFQPSLIMRAGIALEPTIAAEYGTQTGSRIFNCNIGDLPVFPTAKSGLPKFIFADPDRIVAGNDNGTRFLLECKSVYPAKRKDWGDEWSDAVPMGYLVQGQWYMGILELEVCDYAVYFGADLQIFRTKFNPQIFGALVEQAKEFWAKHMIPDIAPSVGGSKSNEDLLSKLHPIDVGTEIVSTPEIEATLALLRAANERMKSEEEEIRERKNTLRQFIGNNSALVDTDGKPLATWKKSKDTQKVNYKALTAHLEVKQTVLDQFSELKEGSRRLLLK